MFLAAAVAILAAGFPADLPFRLDDYVLLPRTGMLLGLEPWSARAEEDSWRTGGVCVAGRAADLIRPFFRPTAWVLWRAVGEATDLSWRPGPFRALSIAAHVTAVLLFFLVLRRACGLGAGAATIGAVFFAVHPGGRQAYTWISALPDVLMTVSALGLALAVVRAKARPGRAPLVLACVFATLGGLSKEGLPFLLPGVAVLYLLSPARATVGRTLQAGVAVVFGYALALAVRRWNLGTWSFAHFVDVAPNRATAEAFVAAALQAIVPLSTSPTLANGSLRTPEAVWMWRGAVALGCGALWIAAAWRGPAAFLRATTMLIAATASAAVLLLPAAILSADWPPEARATAGLSRSFYPVVAVTAAAIANNVATAWRNGGPVRRRLVVGATALLAAVVVASAVVSAGDEAQAGAQVRAGLDAIRAAQADVGPTGAVVAVSGAVPRDGLPRLEHVLEAAFAPPFALPSEAAHAAAAVFWAPVESALFRRPRLADVVGPIVVLGPELEGYPRSAPTVDAPSSRPVPGPQSRTAGAEAARLEPAWRRLPPARTLDVSDGAAPDGRFLRIAATDAVRFRVEAVLFDDGPFAVRTVFTLDRAALMAEPDGGRRLPLDRTAFASAVYEFAPDLAAVERAASEAKLRGVAAPPALLRITALGADGAILARSPSVRTPFALP